MACLITFVFFFSISPLLALLKSRPYLLQALEPSFFFFCPKVQSFCYAYLLPLLLPAGGFFSWRSGPPAPKPTAGWLDTPKVRPADGFMPGLLKLKPELLVLPKPSGHRKDIQVMGRCCRIKEKTMIAFAAMKTTVCSL